MEEFTNLIAQAQHNPTFNVYLCWFVIFCFMYYRFLQTVKGVESLSELQKEWAEKEKFIVKGEFTSKNTIYTFLIPVMIAVVHDSCVVLFNLGEPIIVVYNKLFFSQFLSFTTISYYLTS